MTTRHRHTQDRPMANSSQRMALNANKNKNWRANYLRALNIFTPDLATSTRGRYGPADAGRRTGSSQQAQPGRSEVSSRRRPVATDTIEETARRSSSNNSRGRSSVSTSTSARQSSSRSGSSSRSRRGTSPSEEKNSSYVFGLRSHLFRARRLPTRNDVVVERVSAPIEIPTGSSVSSPTAIPSRGDKLLERGDSETHRRRGSSNDFQNSNDPKQPMQLLSWEEPSVMLGSGGWPLESEKRNNNNNGLAIQVNRNDGRARRSSRPYSGPEVIAEECEDTEEEDLDGLTNTEDDEDDDIFKMEFEGDSKACNNVFRERTTKNKRHENLRQRRPGGFDDFDDEEDDVVTPLSASFVPPHQMVERGCFSLGLRDELKRKPGVHT